MTDLDIQIDVPDDDGLNNPVRVVNGGWLPPWFKAVAALLVGLLALILVAAYLLGRSGTAGPGTDDTAGTTTPIASTASTPTLERSLEAVQAWETFARTGDLTAVAPHFDPAGPQYALFAAGTGVGTTPPAQDLDFEARVLSEARSDDLTTVSLDLVVTSASGQEVFPYDLVFRRGSDLVWTVVDRRSPGEVALPPSDEVIASANQTWTLLTSSLAINDGAGVSEVVSEPTRELARQVVAVAGGATPGTAPAIDSALFDQLVAQIRQAGITDADQALVGLLDADQRRALATGQLTAWTQVAPDRVVATLVVDDSPAAVVPFVASGEGWVFDLVGALNTSEGADQ